MAATERSDILHSIWQSFRYRHSPGSPRLTNSLAMTSCINPKSPIPNPQSEIRN